MDDQKQERVRQELTQLNLLRKRVWRECVGAQLEARLPEGSRPTALAARLGIRLVVATLPEGCPTSPNKAAKVLFVDPRQLRRGPQEEEEIAKGLALYHCEHFLPQGEHACRQALIDYGGRLFQMPAPYFDHVVARVGFRLDKLADIYFHATPATILDRLTDRCPGLVASSYKGLTLDGARRFDPETWFPFPDFADGLGAQELRALIPPPEYSDFYRLPVISGPFATWAWLLNLGDPPLYRLLTQIDHPAYPGFMQEVVTRAAFKLRVVVDTPMVAAAEVATAPRTVPVPDVAASPSVENAASEAATASPEEISIVVDAHCQEVIQPLRAVTASNGKTYLVDEYVELPESGRTSRTHATEVGDEDAADLEIKFGDYLGAGLSNAEIASAMRLPRSEVQRLVTMAIGRAGVTNRAALVEVALRARLMRESDLDGESAYGATGRTTGASSSMSEGAAAAQEQCDRVLALLAEGLRNAEIATKMDLPLGRVHAILTETQARTGTASRAALAAMARVQLGIEGPDAVPAWVDPVVATRARGSRAEVAHSDEWSRLHVDEVAYRRTELSDEELARRVGSELASGHSNAEIASDLGIPEAAVRQCLAQLQARSGARNRAELVEMARRELTE